VVYETQKIPVVKHVLHQKAFESVLIFCTKKQNVKQLNRTLKGYNFSVEEIHSDLDQKKEGRYYWISKLEEFAEKEKQNL